MRGDAEASGFVGDAEASGFVGDADVSEDPCGAAAFGNGCVPVVDAVGAFARWGEVADASGGAWGATVDSAGAAFSVGACIGFTLSQ
jgi:hypothetical protein